MGKEGEIESMTPEQRRRVNENLGLVAVHLKRFVTNLGTPRRDREWEDLFQEGCLGLIKAAILFREERGIPFAAFALPRIHNAVSRALQTKFRNVRVPTPRRRHHQEDEVMRDRNNPHNTPREYSLGDEAAPVRQSADRHEPGTPHTDDTIGDRLRMKYERAVRRARKTLAERSSSRDDRDALLEILERERFLIPQEDQRRPLRQIARDTKSSYARVAQCDKRMGELVRQLLKEDAEFVALQDRARRSPRGGAERVDAAFDHKLAEACAEQFTKKFHDADRATRGMMLAALLATSEEDIDHLIRERFRSATPEDRTVLLDRIRR